MKSILLVDLSSIYWQNWHATKDQEIGRAFELTIDKIYRYTQNYDHVGICLDSPPYKRKEIDANYKAQRDKPDQTAIMQMERVKERLTTDGYPLFAADGAEADDVIASLVEMVWSETADDHRINIDILTGDKDLTQLVDADVDTISTQTGDRYGVQQVYDKYGVYPSQMHDFLAICGDKSDNIPGVRGIGPKGAVELIEAFDSVPELCRHIDGETDEFKELKPSIVNNLTRDWDNLKKSYELVKLDNTLVLPMDALFAERVPQPLSEPETATEGQPEPAEKVPVVNVTATDVYQPVVITKPTIEYSKSLEPQDIKAAYKLAKHLEDSRLYTKYGNADAILAAILRGRELGFGAISSLEAMNSVMGNGLTWTVDAIAGLVLKSGKAEYLKPVILGADVATYKTHRKDDPDPEPIVMSFTTDDAAAMGLLGKKFWKTMKPTMLRRRALSQICREVYPDVVGGLFSDEELKDV